MDKIFLSHSSADKPYVSFIADALGKDRCVYDTMCFEIGLQTIDEIFRGLGQSSIFVFFISEDSLSSEWVRTELDAAEERLHHDLYKISQIFPIIIDSRITHRDKRIPQFLKTGMHSYNLRYIASNKVAYRKILAQLKKHIFENDKDAKRRIDYFYGRDDEIKAFKQKFDMAHAIKCLVVSGLEGVGRRSYITKCLKEAQIINEYYEPVRISMRSINGIEDLIIKLSEVGFGNQTIETVSAMRSPGQRTQALVNLLINIQDYNEHVIIYDDGCIVDYRGLIQTWFKGALDKIRGEITISLAAKNSVSERYANSNPWIFAQDLSVLKRYEWLGLMRVYGNSIGVALSQKERERFKDILNGYPPQVIYCIDYIRDTSLEYVMAHSYEIVEKFSTKVTQILSSSIPEALLDSASGFLSFLSHFGVVPTILVFELLNLNSKYKDIFKIFRTLTICRYLGATGEYIEVNPMVSNYIQRNKYALPDDIRAYVATRLDLFNRNINDPKISEYEDSESIKFYLKENLMANKVIPERFMYSTVYLSAIYDLYNQEKYPQVISIVKKLKDDRVFELYDPPAQSRIQSHFCMALAREGDRSFFPEVEIFKSKDVVEYHFLSGFMYRCLGDYGRALDEYKKVLHLRPSRRSAMREIVIVYKGLEDYTSSFDYAKSNYENDPENLYQIQPYFEILIRRPAEQRTVQDGKTMAEIVETMSIINENLPSPQYYELMAQYSAYIENDQQKSYGFLDAGVRLHPDSSYLARATFDCCEYFRDIEGMRKSLERLRTLSTTNKATATVYNMRKPVMDSYAGCSTDFVEMQISQILGINQDSKDRLLERCKRILHEH